MKIPGTIQLIKPAFRSPIKNRPLFTTVIRGFDSLKQIVYSDPFCDRFFKTRTDLLVPLSTGRVLSQKSEFKNPVSPDIFEATCNRESLILFLMLAPLLSPHALRIVGRVENDAFDQRQVVHVFLQHGTTVIDPTYRSFLFAHTVEVGRIANKIGQWLHGDTRTHLINRLSIFNNDAFNKPWCFIGNKQTLIDELNRRQTDLEALLYPFRTARSAIATRIMGPNRFLDAYLHLPANPALIWEQNTDYTDECLQYLSKLTKKNRTGITVPPFDLTIGGIQLEKLSSSLPWLRLSTHWPSR